MITKWLKKIIKPCEHCGNTDIDIQYGSISKVWICKCNKCKKSVVAITPFGILMNWNVR